MVRQIELPHQLPEGCQGQAWTSGYGRCVVQLRRGAHEVWGGGLTSVVALARANQRLQKLEQEARQG